MTSKLYVGNLSYGVDDHSLNSCFSAHGTVQSAQVIMDRETGQSRGFGFVEMSDASAATTAIEALDNADVAGRRLKVNLAKPRR